MVDVIMDGLGEEMVSKSEMEKLMGKSKTSASPVSHDAFVAAAMSHVNNASQQVVNGTKNGRPVTQFDGRTGKYARNLHLKAGGCEKTSGASRLVL